MIACPNKSSKDWKDLVSKIGEFEATREYLIRGDGTIPKINETALFKDLDTSSETIAISEKIKSELPIEIFDALTILDDVPLDVFERNDLFLSMKDILEENNITDPLLINWAGINKNSIGNLRNIKSEEQLTSIVEKRYKEKQKENQYIEFKTNPLALKSFNEWKDALKDFPIVFQDIMLTHAIKYLNNPTRRSKYVLELSNVALTNTYGILINKPNEANRLGKLYDMEVIALLSDAVDHEPAASGDGYWVYIPKTNSTNFGHKTYAAFKNNTEQKIELSKNYIDRLKIQIEPTYKENLIEKLENLKNKKAVFKSQEANLNRKDANKYGFKEYTFVRVESSYSRGDHSYSKFLGDNYEGYWIHGYNTDSNKPSTKIIPITKEQAEEIWKEENKDYENFRSFELEDRNVVLTLQSELNALKDIENLKNILIREELELENLEETLKNTTSEKWDVKGISEYEKNIELLRKLSPSSWCTASGMTDYYVQNYDNYLLIVNGVTVAGIEAYPVPAIENKETLLKKLDKIKSNIENGVASLDEYSRKNEIEKLLSGEAIKNLIADKETLLNKSIKNEDTNIPDFLQLQFEIDDLKEKLNKLTNTRKVKEVTSRANNGTASIDHLDDTIAFFKKHNLDLNNETIKKAIKAKAAGKVDADASYYNYEEAWDNYNYEQEYDDRGDVDDPGLEYRREQEEEENLRLEENFRNEVSQLTTVEETLLAITDGIPVIKYFYELPQNIRNNEGIARRAIIENAHNIRYISYTLPFYNELAQQAVENNPYVFIYLPLVGQNIPGLREIYDAKQKEDELLDLPFSKTNKKLIQGYYDPKTDKVVVISKNTPVNEASKIAIHEVAHRGMIRMAKELGGVDELNQVLLNSEVELMKKVPELLIRTGHTSIKNLVKDYGFAINTKEGKMKLLMELSARWAETLVDKPKPSWWKEFLENIRQWITNFTGVILNEKEVNELVAGFVKYGTSKQKNEISVEIATEEEQKQKIGQNVVYEMANVLAQNFGVSFEIVTADEARALTKDTEVPWNGEPAFFFNGKVYFTEEGFTMENVLHEYSHPLLDCLHAQNPVLFNNLIADALGTAEGIAVLADVLNTYGQDIDLNDPRFSKEILARLLSKEAQNRIENKPNTKEFKGFIDRLLFNIKQLLRKTFGVSIKIEKLSTKTTLKELTEMLRGDKFDINTDIITHDTYVEYARAVTKESESFEKVENNNISKSIKLYYNLVRTQIRETKENAEKYADPIKVLVSDQTHMSLLEEIQKTLENTPELQRGDVSTLSDVEIREQNVKNFVYAMQRFQIMTMKVLDHLDELGKRSDSVQTMNDVFYYDLLSRNWSKFIEETHELLTANGMSNNSSFGQIMNEISGNLKTIDTKIQATYTPGVIKVLTEHLQPLAEGIDKHYEEELNKIKNNTSKLGWGDKQKLIDKVQKEWDDTKLTEERITNLLFGKEGDSNKISFWIESFLNSPDPIIGGLGIFVKNQFNNLNAEFQRDSNDFIRDMAPLLEAAGYSMRNFTELMSKISFKDTSLFYDNDTDSLEQKVLWTFLNEFKNTNSILKKQKHDYDKAIEQGDQEEADRIIKEIRQHKKDYFHQEYVDDYYKREDVYDSLDKNKDLEDAVYKILGVDKATATKDQKLEAAEMYDKAAKEAYRRKHTILNQIKVEDGANFVKEDYDSVMATKKALWREYTQLASFTNLSGDPKTGEELLVSIIENKYRKITREFYEWTPREGQFEFGLNSYEQQLISNEKLDPDGPEFKEKRDKWIKDNTVIKYTQKYYDDRNKILSDIRTIMERIEKINPDIRKRIDSSLEMEEFLDIALGYRDSDGQVMGNDISEKGKERVKALQQAIIDKKDQYTGLSGLTKQEDNELGELFDKIHAKQTLSTTERIRLDDLLDKKAEFGIDKATRTELTALYRKLFQIQSKEATDYYVDILNNWLGKIGEPDMVDNFTADNVLEPGVYTKLLAKDAGFKKWFEKNHIKKEIFDPTIGDHGDYVMVYERLFIWNRTRPNDAKYYETTTLDNGEIIEGVPSLSFFDRQVKDKYRTEQIVGETIDNKGNFLPKTVAQGAKADTPYINENYQKLKKSDPAAFKVLEKMKEYHLKWQTDLDEGSRLYLQVPRYGITAGENLTVSNKVDKARRFFHNVKNLFNKSAINIEQLALNYQLKNQLIEVENMFEQNMRKIPVTGLTDIDESQVSMDFLDGIMKYRHGALTQKTLLAADPFAQALKKIANDPKNLPIETAKWSKFFLNSALSRVFPKINEAAEEGLKKIGKKKTTSTRANAIDFFYSREFEGKRIIDGTQDEPWIWRIYKFCSGITSKAVFAWNIPSAAKNRAAAIVSAYIEAGGGRFISPQSIALGKPRAMAMMGELGIKGSIYSYKNKSLNVQLMQIFNVGQEFLDHSIHKHFGRSLKNDFANLSFLMSPRKFLQMEATLEILNGMLNHVKIEQKTKTGKNEIRYINAWEIRNGQIELKPGINPEYAPGGKKFNEIINQIHQVSENLEGNYAKLSQPYIDSFFLGKLGTYMKKFFTSMGLDHIAGKRTSASLGTVKTGSFTAMLNLVGNIITLGPRAISMMSKDQVTGVRKTLVHIASVILIEYLLKSLWGYDDDDLKKTKARVKARSGDLGDADFKFWGWTQNQALVVTIGTLTETETWSNPTLFVPQLKTQYLSWGPIYDRGIKMPIQIVSHATGSIIGKKTAFYSKKVGPYWFQQKGSSKMWMDLGNLFGLTGNTVSPVKQIESQWKIRQGLSLN